MKLFYILYKMWLKLAEHISSQNCVSDVRLYYKALNACLSTLIRKYTKIKIFNVCMKSVLLYGCETWLVTSEIRRKIQTFVNRCLRYILRIWWPNISNKSRRKEDGGKYQKLPYCGTLKEVGREEDLRIAREDRSSKKWVEAGMN